MKVEHGFLLQIIPTPSASSVRTRSVLRGRAITEVLYPVSSGSEWSHSSLPVLACHKIVFGVCLGLKRVFLALEVRSLHNVDVDVIQGLQPSRTTRALPYGRIITLCLPRIPYLTLSSLSRLEHRGNQLSKGSTGSQHASWNEKPQKTLAVLSHSATWLLSGCPATSTGNHKASSAMPHAIAWM